MCVCVATTFLTAKPAILVHQPTWNAFQGSTGDNATENPFVQAPIVSPSAKRSIFTEPDRKFVPNLHKEKTQSKNQLENNVTIPKLARSSLDISRNSHKLDVCIHVLLLWTAYSQELGKEEKILSGTFHDGDSE
ncbi:hypothetical protein PsorP6_006930 [Peronosclerospora sorghi]|uniref:Uncharacterized protein n=1 Tax=Peronosclerospora sorghi TaxID=230839 RepID=A0ACC0WAH4_9STRA|nr:hypothetical protein PsorP6_006930 [Peronosclerospora sorghi]